MWDGFTMSDSEYFKVPNNIVDKRQHINNMAELKIILYVMRHTWGFQEYDEYKKITTDEFVNGRMLSTRERMDNGTGLSDYSVQHGVAKAIEHGFLEVEIDDSDLGRIKKSYRLKMKPDQMKSKDCTEEKPKTKPERLKELQSMPYPEYLKTAEWAAKRAKALRFAGYRCQLCNGKESLNVHHRTYERLGHELMGDLTVLCAECHSTFTYNRELAQ